MAFSADFPGYLQRRIADEVGRLCLLPGRCRGKHGRPRIRWVRRFRAGAGPRSCPRGQGARGVTRRGVVELRGS